MALPFFYLLNTQAIYKAIQQINKLTITLSIIPKQNIHYDLQDFLLLR